MAQGLEASIPVPVGLDVADCGLAEQIHRPGTTIFPEIRQDRERFLHRAPGDEGSGHLLDLMADSFPRDGGPHICRCQCFEAPLQSEYLAVERSKVLFRQPYDSLIRGDGREHIDEAEQLDFECRIFHRQVDYAV